jgi:hypothetical protein
MAITAPVTTRGKGGFRSCTYRDAQGRTWDATIVGPGSTSGYKIRVTSRRSMGSVANVNIDNVPLATSLKGATPAIWPRIS